MWLSGFPHVCPIDVIFHPVADHLFHQSWLKYTLSKIQHLEIHEELALAKLLGWGLWMGQIISVSKYGIVPQNSELGAGVVTQQVKLPPGTPLSHI